MYRAVLSSSSTLRPAGRPLAEDRRGPQWGWTRKSSEEARPPSMGGNGRARKGLELGK